VGEFPEGWHHDGKGRGRVVARGTLDKPRNDALGDDGSLEVVEPQVEVPVWAGEEHARPCRVPCEELVQGGETEIREVKAKQTPECPACYGEVVHGGEVGHIRERVPDGGHFPVKDPNDPWLGGVEDLGVTGGMESDGRENKRKKKGGLQRCRI